MENVQPLRKSIHTDFGLEFIFSKKVFTFEDLTAKMVFKSQIKKNVETNSAGGNLMSLYDISRKEV